MEYSHEHGFSIEDLCRAPRVPDWGPMSEWICNVFSFLGNARIPAASELAFIVLATQGHLQTLKRIHMFIYPFTPQFVRTYRNFAVVNACTNGHLATARWLVETFGLTAVDLACFENRGLLNARANGHDDVANWLQNIYMEDEAAA